MPMNLRRGSMIRLPGRYQEHQGPTLPEKPIFLHPDVEFNPSLSRHCAFPSLPIDYPGLGPSQLWAAKERAREEEEEDDESDDESDDMNQDNDKDKHKNKDGERLIFLVTRRMAQTQLTHLGLTSGDPQPLGEGGRASLAGPPGRGRLTATIINRPKTPPTLDPGQPLLPQEQRAYCVSLARRAAPRHAPMTDSGGREQSRRVAGSNGVEPKFIETDSNGAELNFTEADNDGVELKFIESLPQWSDLSDAMKYIILHELTRQSSFTRAVKQLGLTWPETHAMIEVVRKEMEKDQIHTDKLEEYDHMVREGLNLQYNHAWLDEFIQIPQRPFLTDNITAQEMKPARAYLNFLGLKDIAGKLGEYRGSTGVYYDVPLTHYLADGYRSLIPHFNNGNRDELLECAREAKKGRAKAISGGELHVRLDAPWGTINPKRLESHYPGGNALNPETLSYGIDPANFDLDTLETGQLPDIEAVKELQEVEHPEGRYPWLTPAAEGVQPRGGLSAPRLSPYTIPRTQIHNVGPDFSEPPSPASLQHLQDFTRSPQHSSPDMFEEFLVPQHSPGTARQSFASQNGLLGLTAQFPGPQYNSPGMTGRSLAPRYQDFAPQQDPGMIGRFPGSRHNLPGVVGQFPGPQHNLPGASRQSPRPQHYLPGVARRSPGPQYNLPGAAGQSPRLHHNIPGVVRQSPSSQHNLTGMVGRFPEPQYSSSGVTGRSPRPHHNSLGIAGRFSGPQYNLPGVTGQSPRLQHNLQSAAKQSPEQPMQIHMADQQQAKVPSFPELRVEAPGAPATSAPNHVSERKPKVAQRGAQAPGREVMPLDASLQESVKEILGRHQDVLKDKPKPGRTTRSRKLEEDDDETLVFVPLPPDDEDDEDYSETRPKKRKRTSTSAITKKARTAEPNAVAVPRRPVGRPRKTDAERAAAVEAACKEFERLKKPESTKRSSKAQKARVSQSRKSATEQLGRQGTGGVEAGRAEPLPGPNPPQTIQHQEHSPATQMQQWLSQQVPQIMQGVPGTGHDPRQFAPPGPHRAM